MDILLDEITAAANGNLGLLAVHGALTLPDVCSALETNEPLKPGTIGVRYSAWFDTYLGDRYGAWLSGWDVYNLRCKVLHQGEMQHPRNTATIFFSPDFHCVSFGVGEEVQEVGLRAPTFALDLVNAARAWRAAKVGDPDVQRRMASLIQVYRGSSLVYAPMVR